MASLGLGWVGEPTVAALLKPVLIPLGMRNRPCISRRLVGFLVFSSLTSWSASRCPKTSRSASRCRCRSGSPIRSTASFAALSVELAAQCGVALDPAAARRQGTLDAGNPDRCRDRGAGGGLGRAGEHGGRARREYIQNVFRFGELEVSDVMIHRTNMITLNADDTPEDIVNAVIASPVTRLPLWRGNPENIVGILHVEGSAARAARGRRRCIAGRHRVADGAAMVRAGHAAASRSSSRRSAAAGRRSRWWSTNTARFRAW